MSRLYNVLNKVVGKLQIVKTKSITTVTNANVSPYGAYVQASYSDITPTGYTLTDVCLSGGGSTNPTSARIQNSTDIFVYSKTAATFTAYFTFTKNGEIA